MAAKTGFAALGKALREQQAEKAKRAAPKRAKGTLGKIGAEMQRQQRPPPRKRARGTLGQIGTQMRARQTDLRESFGSF